MTGSTLLTRIARRSQSGNAWCFDWSSSTVLQDMHHAQSTVVRSKRASSGSASAAPGARGPGREVCASRDRCVDDTPSPSCPPPTCGAGACPFRSRRSCRAPPPLLGGCGRRGGVPLRLPRPHLAPVFAVAPCTSSSSWRRPRRRPRPPRRRPRRRRVRRARWPPTRRRPKLTSR